MRAATVALVVVMTATAALASITAGDRGTTAAPATPTVAVTVGRAVTRVPRNFASFSLEVPCPAVMFYDSYAGGPRTSYVNMLRWLRNVSHGGTAGNSSERSGPNVRIGGNSADITWFEANKTEPAPSGYRYVVSDTDLRAFAAVAEWSGTLSIDLGMHNATDPSNAFAYGKAAAAWLQPADILNFEIGNEPELFERNGLRPKPYTFAEWEQQWLMLAAPLTHFVSGNRSIQGAVFCCGEWERDLPGYIEQYTSAATPYLQTISHHYYPMSGADATIAKLLDNRASNMGNFAKLAHDCDKHGIELVIGEGNSAYDGGKDGVSDAFASTLWSTDMLFESAKTGIRRFNFHGCERGAYTPVAINETDGAAIARPLYYGMWAFTAATAEDSTLLDTHYDAADTGVKAWATTRRGAVVVTLIHKKPVSLGGANVSVSVDLSSVPGVAKASAAVRTRVTAPGGDAAATSGVSFGGLSFDGVKDGLPQGVPSVEFVRLAPGGKLDVTLPPAEISIFTISILE